jgi:hypothetical protein
MRHGFGSGIGMVVISSSNEEYQVRHSGVYNIEELEENERLIKDIDKVQYLLNAQPEMKWTIALGVMKDISALSRNLKTKLWSSLNLMLSTLFKRILRTYALKG